VPAVGSAFHLLSRRFLVWLILRSWRWRRHVSPKRQLTFNGFHGVISHKTEFSTVLTSVYIIVTYIRHSVS
jgi:uncharacterized membrane protein YjgN (DUF898 family)